MERTKFLARVRDAAHAGRAFRVHTREIPAGTGYVGAGDDLCGHFASEVNAVGGQATIVTSHAEARVALDQLLDFYSVHSALCWMHPVLERLQLNEMLAARQIVAHSATTLVKHDRADQRTTVLACDIGITSVTRAIAETGTLMMSHAFGNERMASLVPPVHVAIVEEEQIVPDLFDVFGELQRRDAAELPTNITLITGPSKTGDIELQLTTGVHGPKHWRVIVIRGRNQ